MKDDQNPQRLTGVGPPAHDLGKGRAKRLEGHGPPLVDEGQLNSRYLDLDSGEYYSKRKTGWTNRTEVVFHPTIRQKNEWKRAVPTGMKFEEWVIETLDAGAKKPGIDPSLESPHRRGGIHG